MTHADYLKSRGYPEYVDGELYFHPVPPKCAACTGLLVGDEIRFGTCGHCGGRSISRDGVPSSRPGHLSKGRP